MARYGASAPERAGNAFGKVAGLVGPEHGGIVGLRFVFDPRERSGQARLRIYFRAPGFGVAGDFVGSHLVRPFYRFAPASSDEVKAAVDAMGEPIVRLLGQGEEEVASHDGTYYYSPVPFDAKQSRGSRSLDLDDLFDGLCEPCVVDLLAVPTRLDAGEVQAIGDEVQLQAWRESGGEVERREKGSLDELARHRDALARRHREYLEEFTDRLLARDVFEFTVRVVSPNDREGALVARSIGQSVASGSPFEVMTASPGDDGYGEAVAAAREFRPHLPAWAVGGQQCYSARLAERLGELATRDAARAVRLAMISRLCYLADGETMAVLLRLPTSTGVPFRTIAIESELRAAKVASTDPRELIVGTDLERGRPAIITLDQLLRHGFLTGMTGSGKSNTAELLLTQVWGVHRVPFAVFEPPKSEYRRLLRAGGNWEGELRVFSPGNERVAPFRFNPFAVPDGCSVEEHIALVEGCFAGALPLGGPLQSLVEKAIRLAYEEAGIEESDLGEECARFPVMDDVVESARRLMAEQGYEGEVKSNVQAAMQTRLERLCRGGAGRLFRAGRTSPSIEELLRWPAVFELQGLNHEQQNLFTLFLLTSLHHALRVKGPSKTLRYLIVIEEAHNLVAAVRASTNPEVADSQGNASQLIVRLLAEVRAYGVGVLVVDQTPTAVAPEVLKNTNVKFPHRTTEQEDRELIAGSTLLDEDGTAELARLLRGEAFLFHDLLHRPARVAVDLAPLRGEGPSDAELRSLLLAQPWFSKLTLAMAVEDMDRLLASVKQYLATAIQLSKSRAGRHNAPSAKELGRMVERARRKLERRSRGLDGVAGGVGARVREASLKRFSNLVREATSAFGQ